MRLPESALSEHYVRSSGPGGQNVNKVATAVELRLDLGRSGLPDEVKARLRAIAGSRMTTDDVLIVEAREHRTQGRNREAARERLAALLARASRRPKARRRTRPTKVSRERRLTEKKQRSSVKRQRRSPAGEND